MKDNITKVQLAKHLEVLEEKVFRVETHTPQFKPMLDRLQSWAKKLSSDSKTLVIERAYLHKANCIFAPFFSHTNLTAIDCIVPTAEKNFGFLSNLSDSPDLIHWEPDFRCPADALPLESNSIDWLTCPNAVHHIKNQAGMAAEWSRVLKPGGRAFIFEGLVRELHQVPDDYVRYTPWGFETLLNDAGLQLESWEPVSGVFDVLAYAWQQAIDFFPPEKKKEMSEWFYGGYFQQLQNWNKEYTVNLRQKDKQFPMGFLYEVVKP